MTANKVIDEMTPDNISRMPVNKMPVDACEMTVGEMTIDEMMQTRQNDSILNGYRRNDS